MRWICRGFLDSQIAKQSEECGERNAHRFVMTMQFGGCTDAEAYNLMRDRLCAHEGTGCELCDVAHIPTDRWFRDAWIRSLRHIPRLLVRLLLLTTTGVHLGGIT